LRFVGTGPKGTADGGFVKMLAVGRDLHPDVEVLQSVLTGHEGRG
jgi:hypothetical protein